MKKLIEQILKFGVVGVICFAIDFLITLVVSALLRKTGMDATTAALIGAFFGFTISVIVNYLLSMKFVFTRDENMSRKREFIIFVILSLVGLGLNELIIKGGMELYAGMKTTYPGLSEADGIATALAKVIATGIVMVYNFVTRKIFLEKKPDPSEQ